MGEGIVTLCPNLRRGLLSSLGLHQIFIILRLKLGNPLCEFADFHEGVHESRIDNASLGLIVSRLLENDRDGFELQSFEFSRCNRLFFFLFDARIAPGFVHDRRYGSIDWDIAAVLPAKCFGLLDTQ